MTRKKQIWAVASVLAFGVPVAFMAGCQANTQVSGQETSGGGYAVEVAQQTGTGLSGAQLWAQTCAHCHNSRSPGSYSDAKWALTMRHMREQAYLTGDQARSILEFLQASN